MWVYKNIATPGLEYKNALLPFSSRGSTRILPPRDSNTKMLFCLSAPEGLQKYRHPGARIQKCCSAFQLKRVYKNFATPGLENKNAVLPFSSRGAAFL